MPAVVQRKQQDVVGVVANSQREIHEGHEDDAVFMGARLLAQSIDGRELVRPAMHDHTQVGALISSRLSANRVPIQETRAMREVGLNGWPGLVELARFPPIVGYVT